jgi:hypothetical protein
MNDVIRFLCLDIVHLDCLDKHCSALPSNTALAGFTCPVCTKPLVPPQMVWSPLSEDIIKHLSRFSWINRMLPPLPKPPHTEESTVTVATSAPDTPIKTYLTAQITPVKSNAGESTPSHNSSSVTLVSVAETTSPPTTNKNSTSPSLTSPQSALSSETPAQLMSSSATQNSPTTTVTSNPSFQSSTVTVASRKPHPQTNANTLNDLGLKRDTDDDDDNNKYKKKSVWHIFEFLGVVSSPSNALQSRHVARCNRKRIFLLILFLSTFLMLVYLSSSLTELQPAVNVIFHSDNEQRHSHSF